jgi:hypothetical protein
MKHPWGLFVFCLLLSTVLVSAAPRFAFASVDHPELIAVGETSRLPATRHYIRAHAVDELDVVNLRKRLIANGARKVNLFLPQQIIVCDVPEAMDLGRLISDPRVAYFEESRIGPQLAAGGVDDLGFVKMCYDRLERPVPRATAEMVEFDFDDVLLRSAPEDVKASKEKMMMLAEGSAAAERTIEQNSEFLVGDVLVQLVFPESMGNTENWTDELIAQAASGGFAAVMDYQAKFGSTPIHFVLKSEPGVPTTYEPILTNMDEHVEWISEVMTYLGFGGERSAPMMVHEFNNFHRRYYGTDWAFTAFIASSENAPNHRFADQFYTAYAQLGGPYMVMPYPAGEQVDGVDEWLVYSTVFQHEMGHIFWALDEYPAQINMTNCGTRTGYLGYANMNKVTELLDGTYQSCPGIETEVCIMWRAKEDHGRPVCPFTEGQIGVIDFNGNNIPDVFDAPPTIEFEGTAVETVQVPDITVNMKAVSVAVENVNPLQDPESRRSYAPPLKDAFLNVDGIGGVRLAAEDGRWDEVEEDLSITIKGVKVGLTEIGVTVRNSFGRTSPEIIKKIYFAGINFAFFDARPESGGIKVTWSTVGETFGAKLDLYRIDVSSGIPDTTLVLASAQPDPNSSGAFNQYVYRDRDVRPGFDYRYFVEGLFEMVYSDTTIEYNPVSDTFGTQSMFPIPSGGLSSFVSPNPFNQATKISVRIPSSFASSVGDGTQASNGVSQPQKTDIEVAVYDVRGRRIKKLYQGSVFGGVKNFEWDGTNENNTPVTSGVYFVKTNAGAAIEVRKVVLVR